MEKFIDRNSFERLVSDYYKKYEERDVMLKTDVGRIRTVIGAMPRPDAYALQFELIENVLDGISGEQKVISKFVSDDDIAKAVSTGLEDENFLVDELKFNTIPVEGGIAFTGITVHGEEKEKLQGKEM